MSISLENIAYFIKFVTLVLTNITKSITFSLVYIDHIEFKLKFNEFQGKFINEVVYGMQASNFKKWQRCYTIKQYVVHCDKKHTCL